MPKKIVLINPSVLAVLETWFSIPKYPKTLKTKTAVKEEKEYRQFIMNWEKYQNYAVNRNKKIMIYFFDLNNHLVHLGINYISI